MSWKKYRRKIAVFLICSLLINCFTSLGSEFVFMDEDNGHFWDFLLEETDEYGGATPSELKPSKATPSEATPSEATPPELMPSEKDFKVMTAAEIPCYYTPIDNYYTFKGRDGNAYWRIYGKWDKTVGWYSSDQYGIPSKESVNTEEEDKQLAPYRYKSAGVFENEWKELSQTLFGDSSTILKQERKVVDAQMGMNYDGTYYDVWWIGEELDDLSKEVKYYFYGFKENEKGEDELTSRWYECNEQGVIVEGTLSLENTNIKSGISGSWSVSGDTLTVTITGNYNLQTWWTEDSYAGDAVSANISPLLAFNGAKVSKNYTSNSENSSKVVGTSHSGYYQTQTIYYRNGKEVDSGRMSAGNSLVFDYLSLPAVAKTSYSDATVATDFSDKTASNICPDKALLKTKRTNYEKGIVYNSGTTSNGIEYDAQGTLYIVSPVSSITETTTAICYPGDLVDGVKAFESMQVVSDFGTKRRGELCTTKFIIKNPHPQLSSVNLVLWEYGQYHSEKGHLLVDRNEYWVKTLNNSTFDVQAGAEQAHQHDKESVNTTPATCTASGKTEGTCSFCKKTVQEVIPALGHSAPSSYNTSTNTGYHYKYCTRCGVEVEKKANPYTIRYHANDGTGIMANQPMTYDTAKTLSPNTFTRTAYLFDGWTTSPDGSGTGYSDKQSVTNLTKVYNGTVDLYVKWKLNECTITYDGNGGESPLSIKKVICKTDIGGESLPEAVRTGYTFLGWSADKNRPDELLTPDSQFETIKITLYAQWRPNAYPITFDPRGGSLTTTLKSVYYDCQIGELPEPDMQGRTFTGWVRTNEKGRAAIPISESTVLKEEGIACAATYSTEAYTLNFEGNGGSCNAPEVNRSYKQPLGDFPDVSRPGYILKGWFTEREGGNQMLPASEMPAYNLILYAHWYPISYTIRYDANDGSGSMVSQPMTYDVSKELKENKFSRTDFKFIGWCMKQDGNGTIYKDTEPVENLTANDKEEVVLYAQWQRTGALCTFYNWDDSLLGTATIEVGSDIKYTTSERSGYTFIGWEGLDGAPLNNVTLPGSYKAVYKINKYKAIFSDGEQRYEIEQEYGQPLGALPNTEKEGHNFLGWFTKQEGGVQISSDTTLLGNTTYYAQYETNKYKLSFHYNGGSEGAVSIMTEYGKAVGKLPSSTKTGYVFTGWNTQEDMQGQSVAESFLMPASDLELYASWAPAKVSCVFLDDGGNEIERQTVVYGENASPAIPYKKGYLFLAWDKSLNEIIEDTVFVASFAPITYTIKFDVNEDMYPGASGKLDEVPAIYDSITRLPESNYRYDHFRFTGWTADAGGKGSLIVNKANTINLSSLDKDIVILYAQFTRTESPCRFLDWNNSPLHEEVILFDKDSTYKDIPKRTGYTFTGWNPEARKIKTPTDFIAQYRPNTYEVIFNANSGTGAMKAQGLFYDLEENLSLNQYQKDYYVFEEWNTKMDGSGEAFSDGKSIVNLINTDKGKVTLYAQWKLLLVEKDNNTHIRPGKDKVLGTDDDEHWWNGEDGKPGTSDDKLISKDGNGNDCIDNGDGTLTHPGKDGIFGTDDDEYWWNGEDGKPGTSDDKLISKDADGNTYIDNEDGTLTRPGKDGIFGTDDDEHYWNGSDGKPGTEDDRKIHPGSDGIYGTEDDYYIDNDGRKVYPGPDKIFGTNDDVKESVKNSSGGGGSGGGISNSGNTLGGPALVPVDGEWSQKTENGKTIWSFYDSNGVLLTGWAYIHNPYAGIGQSTADWFLFDNAGQMLTGWYIENGHWYYLNERSDGTLGRMLVGWFWDELEKRWYYLSLEHDGHYGHAVSGWRIINEKWYYFNEDIAKKPFMFSNENSPDGYWLDEIGEWKK